jgi:hexulose-6-phosphate isomerase
MSEEVDGRIQAFPWPSWREEFPLAEHSGFRLMEWTLDQERLYENPLMSSAGQEEIRVLMRRHGVTVSSLTGDCFMQAPFWKRSGAEAESLRRDFLAVMAACAAVGISTIVVPLVDDGRLENSAQENALLEFVPCVESHFDRLGVRVAFESDFEPTKFRRFIDRFDARSFGINYDIGNSAALGFDVSEEIAAYGHRIFSVHVKDRKRGGVTVPLGSGAAAFEAAFAALAASGYQGNFILQTARSSEGDHVGVLRRYRDLATEWLTIAERRKAVLRDAT